MKNTADSKFNLHIMSVAAAHQAKLQREVGTNWWYVKSKTSVLLTVLHEIGFYFTLLVNFIVSFSYILLLGRNSSAENWAVERVALKSALGSFLFGTLLILAGYVLKKISRHKVKKGGFDGSPLLLISMIVAALGCVILFINAYNILVLGNVDNMYAEAVDASTPFKIYLELICLHVLPLLLVLVPSALFYIMSRCDFNEKKQIYDQMTETLYKDFVAENPDYNAAQWEECLNSFEGYNAYYKKEDTEDE